jgi:predicted nucleotide-binding protein
VFSVDWGLSDLAYGDTSGEWEEYPFERVAEEVLHRAGLPDTKALEAAAKKARSVFENCKEELEATFNALLAEQGDQRIQELRKTTAEIAPFLAEAYFEQALSPSQVLSSDMRALTEGCHTPPHLRIKFRTLSIESHGQSLEKLAKAAREARLYMEKRMSLQGRSVARTEGTIFIGHGHSPVWHELKDFLQNRLSLKPDEFNLESVAGVATKERLEEMLDSAVFAFLVMTAEEQHADKTNHARENVIHEVGLFQGRLGFRRAIVLLEEGCSEFSNIQGIGQIRFPKGNVKAASEQIRQVLEREKILKGIS